MFKFVRSLLFSHWDLKLISLAIAIAMWWGVARDPVVELPVDVQIEFHNVPDNLDISSVNNPAQVAVHAGAVSESNGDVIPHAQVRLRGPARVVRELSRNVIHLAIDLKGATAGERTFNLSPDRFQLPRDVEVIQTVPSQLHVTFDTRATREVEVRARVIGTVAPGYHLVQTVASPAMITVVGPARRVNAIESALTDPVDASGVMGREKFSTHAYISDPMVRPVGNVPIYVIVVTEKTSHPGAP
jgi:YbbR domain-containing protein